MIRIFNHEISGQAKAPKIIGYVLLGVAGVAVLAVIFGIFVKLLWNALMPEIFGLPAITYWQAVGLAVLAHVFFGSDHSHHYERSIHMRKKNNTPESERSPFHLEMEKDYEEFWREEGRESFKSWMRRENSSDSE